MTRKEVSKVALVAAILGITFCGFMAKAQAAGEEELRSLRSQISVLVKVMDAVLVESPNMLVSGRSTAYGAYLEDYGVMLGTRVSVDFPDEFCLDHGWPKGLDIVRDDDGKRVIVIDDHITLKERDEERDLERQQEKWDGAREEMIQFVIDYGPTVRALDDSEKVGVTVYRWDALAGEEIPQFMVVEAKRSDLERFAQDRMSEEDLRKRIKVTEY